MMNDLLSTYARDGFVVLPGHLGDDLLHQLQRRVTALTDASGVPAAATGLVDYEPEPGPDGSRAVQRVRCPHQADSFFWDLARNERLLDPVRAILGDNVRLHHSKINVKAPGIGSPLEWHQDWAFIPHTHPGLAIVSVMIDDCHEVSGPMQFIPGSHQSHLFSHHHDGIFVGAIDPAELDLASACHVTGLAGTVAIHHPLAVHGSGFNLGKTPRRILFFEYAAADAWPLFYGVKWEEFNERLVCGTTTDQPRLGTTAIRMPYPTANDGPGRIYDQQRHFERRHFVAP